MKREALGIILWCLIWIGHAGWAAAQIVTMDARSGILAARAPLVGAARPPLSQQSGDGAAAFSQGSLFTDRSEASFFAVWPDRSEPLRGQSQRATGPTARLLDLIASAEAGPEGYDSVQHGARIKPSKFPTQMTLGEIYTWIDDTPGQPHAIGRYQFIPPTLKRLARAARFGPETRFTPGIQDQLANLLLAEAGIARLRDGVLTRRSFMNNLAKIWAGLPNSTGKSHYHGYAGNKATMSWSRFKSEMKVIFPG